MSSDSVHRYALHLKVNRIRELAVGLGNWQLGDFGIRFLILGFTLGFWVFFGCCGTSLCQTVACVGLCQMAFFSRHKRNPLIFLMFLGGCVAVSGILHPMRLAKKMRDGCRKNGRNRMILILYKYIYIYTVVTVMWYVAVMCLCWNFDGIIFPVA